MSLWVFQVVFYFVACHVYASPPPSTTYRVQMVSQGDDGAYDFAYDTGEGNYRIESRHSNGTITGKFAFLSPDGVLREIGYTADDGGFRPEGDLNPPPPPRGTKTPDPPLEDVRFQNRHRFQSPKTSGQRPSFIPPSPDNFAHHIHNIERTEPHPLVSGPLPRVIDTLSISTSFPLTSKHPFPIAPLLSAGSGIPTPLHDSPPPHKDNDDGNVETNRRIPEALPDETPSNILLSALSQLTGDESPTPPIPIQQQLKDVRPSPQGSRLRQVRLKLLQLITLLEEMELEDDQPIQRRRGRQVKSRKAATTEMPPSLVPSAPSTAPHSKDNITDNESNRFPLAPPTLVVRSAPVLETPLLTPVERVRRLGGQRVLERSYIPLTRRYGYVYSQQQYRDKL